MVILICSDETVILSLFDTQAVAFHRQLESLRTDPKVVVATSINPKMVGGIESVPYAMYCGVSCYTDPLCLFITLGRLFINATSGTHVYFDKKTIAGGVRFYEYVCG